MSIHQIKRRRFAPFLWAAAALPLLGAPLMPAAAAQPAAAPAAPADMDAVKKSLLDDPLFLSHLRDKISSDSINGDLIHQYLLQHPELLMEMQQALAAQSAQGGAANPAQAKLLADNKDFLYNTPNDIIIGNKNAKAAIIEFFDYNCGYCKRDFAQLQQLLAKNKNVKIIMKDYPILSEDSVRAHLVAHAVKKVDPGKYSLFHERMMTMKAHANEASALAVAKQVGVPEAALNAAMTDRATVEELTKDYDLASQLGLSYTPVFISGDKILGAVDIKMLPQMLERAENEAQAAK